MGYTTDFDGQFTLDRLPPAEVIVRLRELEGYDGREATEDSEMPDGYNQWQLTKDCLHIEWDGGEKFYDYEEWLQYLIDYVLKPAGISLTGSVGYSGEDVKDNGSLVIENGVVRKIEHEILGSTLAELSEFKEFVLNSDYADEIMADWKRHHKRKS